MIRLRNVSLVLSVIILVACYLPWISHAANSLSPNALDAAEWITLSPAARSQSIPMSSSFSLRIAVSMALITVTFEAMRSSQVVARVGLGLLAGLAWISLLPPIEFLTTATNDPNYGQQFLISLIAVVSVGCSLALSLPHRRLVQAAVALLGIIFGLWGVFEVRSFFIVLNLPGVQGIGAVIYLGGMLIIAALATREILRQSICNKKPEQG